MPEYSSTTITPADAVKVPAMNGSTSGNFQLDALRNYILASKGQANGLASLGSDGKLPAAQLPDLADDVLVYSSFATFPASGTAGKIYIAADTNIIYRWDSSLGTPAYVILTIDLSAYETKAEASELKSAIQSNTARIENLEQHTGDVKTVSYPNDPVYTTSMPNLVPPSMATNGKVLTIRGKSRPWNNLVDTNTTTVTLTSGHSFLTVISGNASIVSGTGQSVSVTGGTDIVRDLTLIFPEGVPSTVAECVQKCPDILKYDSYGYSLVDTEVSGVKSKSANIWNEVATNGGYIANDGTVATGYNDRVASTNLIPVLPTQRYRLIFPYDAAAYGFRIAWYDADGNLISVANTYDDTPYAPSNAYFMRFSTGGTYGTATYGHDISVVRYDSGITSYVAYHAPSTLSLPTSVILRSAGSVSDTDELNVEVNGVAKRRQTQNIFKLILGNYTWSLVNDNGTCIRFGTTVNDSGIDMLAMADTYNNNSNIVGYQGVRQGSAISSSSSNVNLLDIRVNGDGYLVYINILKTIFTGTTSDEFNTWVNGKEIEYEIKTAIVTLSDPILNNTIATEGGGTINTIQTQTPQIDNCLDVAYLAL